MKVAFAILLLAVAVTASSHGHTRCTIGERGRTFNGTLFDNAVEAPCGDADAVCAYYTYETNSEWGYLNIEYGVCTSRDSSEESCENLTAYLESSGYGNVTNCRLTTDGSRTYKPTPVDKEECESRDEADLYVTPSCTLKQVFYKMSECSANYYNNFPYADRDQCANHVDMIFKCYAEMTYECYSGRCPTVYDEIPGAREMFMQGRDWTFGVNSLDSAIKSLERVGFTNETTGWREFALEAACPTAPGVEPAWVAAYEAMLMDPSSWESMFDNATLALFSVIPCSENYYTIIGEAYLAAARQWYAATDKEAVCKAFNDYKSNTTNAFLTECDLMAFNEDMFKGEVPEEMEPYVEGWMRAATIWGEFFFTYNLPGCNRIAANYTNSCVTGERIWVNGELMSDNTVDALCASSEEHCMEFDYTTKKDGQFVRVQGGSCIHPTLIYDCDAIANYTEHRDFGVVQTCSLSTCSGSYCNDLTPTPATGCSGLVKNDDVQLYPGCTMKQLMHNFYECHAEFYEEFPYDTQEQCGHKRSKFVQCMSKMMDRCLSGRCPTVLDQIPGYRSSFPMVRDLTHNVSNIETVVSRMWDYYLVDEATGKMVIEYFNQALCPDMKDLPTMVEEWFSSFNSTVIAQWLISMDIDLMELQNAMPCNMKYYTSIASAYQEMIGNFFRAEDRDDMCEAYDEYFKDVTTSYQENCNPEKMDDFLYVLMPDWLDQAVPYMVKACEYLGKYFYENPRMPGCDGGHGGHGGSSDMINVNCDSLYKSNTKCGMKKAWLCDYAKWKADFLGNWLQEYVNYQYMGMDMDKLNEMLPPCYKMSDYRGLCRNGDRKLECFTIPVQNCPMCYCTDHEYSDLSGLTQYWRQDYRMWREFFSQYRRQYGSSMGGSHGGDYCDV